MTKLQIVWKESVTRSGVLEMAKIPSTGGGGAPGGSGWVKIAEWEPNIRWSMVVPLRGGPIRKISLSFIARTSIPP